MLRALVLTDRALTVDDGNVPTVIRRGDIADVVLERRALVVTTRRGHLVRVPFTGWQRADVEAVYTALSSRRP